jgi:hypothetical protein
MCVVTCDKLNEKDTSINFVRSLNMAWLTRSSLMHAIMYTTYFEYDLLLYFKHWRKSIAFRFSCFVNWPLFFKKMLVYEWFYYIFIKKIVNSLNIDLHIFTKFLHCWPHTSKSYIKKITIVICKIKTQDINTAWITVYSVWGRSTSGTSNT